MIEGKVIAIVGPTASGKSALAVVLAQELDSEIVSADSRQIYRGMNIGTAKPSTAEMSAIPHHLIDIKNPNEDYTVAEYQKDAIEAIRDVLKRGRLPLLTGGTGLYVKSVLENLAIPAVKADRALRAQIEAEVARDGLAAVFQKLVDLDPEAAYIVDPKNPRRVVRAMEVTLATGVPFTAQRTKQEPLFEHVALGIAQEPEILREKINRRVDEMVKAGLVEEVKKLLKEYGPETAAFDAIGYREIIDHLNGRLMLDEAIAAIKENTVQYARRQMTWFRKDKTTRWIANEAEALAIAKDFLQKVPAAYPAAPGL